MSRHFLLSVSLWLLLLLLSCSVSPAGAFVSTDSIAGTRRLFVSQEPGDLDVDPYNYNQTATATGEVTVQRKGKKGKSKYKEQTDHRDQLPFILQLTTPDPYTRPEIQQAKAKQATKEDRRKSGNNYINKNNNNNYIAASIFVTSSQFPDTNKNRYQILGEFQLDKQTTNGDIVHVGDQRFLVQKARCQYKYVGGQTFAMVRKILEVKELSRALLEEDMAKQFQASLPQDNDLFNLE